MLQLNMFFKYPKIFKKEIFIQPQNAQYMLENAVYHAN
jgi:hypothetical protein